MWRPPLSVGLCVAPSALQVFTMPFCPESPRYLLLTKEKENDAMNGTYIFPVRFYINVFVHCVSLSLYCFFMFKNVFSGFRYEWDFLTLFWCHNLTYHITISLALVKLRGTSGVDDDLNEMRQEHQAMQSEKKACKSMISFFTKNLLPVSLFFFFFTLLLLK